MFKIFRKNCCGLDVHKTLSLIHISTNASYSRARCGLAPISCCLCRAHKSKARAAGK